MRSTLDYVKKLRHQANQYERDEVPGFPGLLRRVANELEEDEREWEWAAIPVAEAAGECGKSPSTIYRYIKVGRLANVGSPEHPLVRRGDLCGKLAPENTGEPSLVSKVI